jgi:hypothetical protein
LKPSEPAEARLPASEAVALLLSLSLPLEPASAVPPLVAVALLPVLLL